MKPIWYLSMLATCTAVLLLLVSEPASAKDSLNLSGKYTKETKDKSEGISNLEIIQNNENIDFIRVEFRKRTVGHCPLNGSEGDYTAPNGELGKCRAKLNPKYLLVESDVMTHPKLYAPTRIHRKEKWHLSSDAKNLIIEYDAGFPDLAPDVSWRLQGKISGALKYKRTSP